MSTILSVTNQKGGVGKTTTAVNLAACIGLLGKKTLLVDIDPQGNATSGVGVDRRYIQASTYDVLIGDADILSTILHTEFKNLDLLPSNISLAGAELELIELDNRESRLKSAIDAVKDKYDFIFIDCPPSLGLITTNALCASEGIIVPMQCEYYALEGLSQLMNTVRLVKRKYNEVLDLLGVVVTMYDARLKLTNQVVSEVEKYFPEKVFATRIPRAVRLSEAPSYGQPVAYFDKACKGTKAYTALAKELKKKMTKKVQVK